MVFESTEHYLHAIEKEMRDSMAVQDSALAPYYGMISYHLGWVDEDFSPSEQGTGKRLRPLLCLLSCEASGGDWRQAVPAAAAIELIHNFSLIHDDIEDNSLQRRHRPTLWSLWGQAQAINVGDGLFAISRLALQRLEHRGVSPDKIVQAFRLIDETCLGLTEGQYLDLAFEAEDSVTVDMYMEMIDRKTASLMACATQLGSLLATEEQDTVEKYRRFGRQLGLAFQIVDDILGIWGQERATGKAVSEDILNKKKTLPIVYALETGDVELWEIYSQESITLRDVQRVTKRLDDLGARDYAHSTAVQHWRLAHETLEKTGIDNPAQFKLRELAHFLIERRH